MIETIIGTAIGCVAGWAIANHYHRLSGRQSQEQIYELEKQIWAIESDVNTLSNVLEEVRSDMATTRKHVVFGTIDDPDWPYK